VGTPIDNSNCCLCGESIDQNAECEDDKLSWDHVPPKQFIPKELRNSPGLNLWKVPSHKGCNGAYRPDEEYFYHAFTIQVQGSNPKIGLTLFNDLRRRVHKPQTPAIIRKILAQATTVTPGGIVLPPPIVQIPIDVYRVQQVALKIVQGLHFREFGQFLPKANCKDIRLCTHRDDVPECYSLTWQMKQFKTFCPAVFSYWCIDFPPKNLILFSLLFWEAFMFCLTFEGPQ